ncbi:hypothetical protein BH09PLA1_BH09PLA1_29290 [soil metagenome]
MTQSSDRELIARYVRRRDHDAFAELVRRYISLVRSAALRQTREPGLADDVTQAAMIVLARRAREISPEVVLASWLFTVTHHLSQNAIKSRARRIAHEQNAAASSGSPTVSFDPASRELRDELDAAIDRLPDLERGGVVLHFFNDCTHEQIGDALGMSGEAVRKRVTRALTKLRELLVRRGFDLSTPELADALKTECAQSPASTFAVHSAIPSIVSIALLSATNAAAASGSHSTILANGMLGGARIALRWKIAASIALAAAGFAGIAAIPLSPPSVQARATRMTAPATQPGAFVVEVTPEITITALGCAPHPAEPQDWFSIDGKPIDLPNEALADNTINSDAQPDRQIAFMIKSPVSTRFMVEIRGAFTSSASMNQEEGHDSLMRCRFGLSDPPPETLSIAFNIATSDWKTVATADAGADPVEVDVDGLGPVTFDPPAEDARWGPHVNVRHNKAELTMQLVAIDANGKEHIHRTLNSNSDGGDVVTSSFLFEVPAKEIRSLKLQIREFDKRVEMTNIALQPDQHTEPKMVVRDLTPKK